jgi:hypothetical protein
VKFKEATHCVTSKHGKQDNINKPKKPGSIEGSPYTWHQKLDLYTNKGKRGVPQKLVERKHNCNLVPYNM